MVIFHMAIGKVCLPSARHVLTILGKPEESEILCVKSVVVFGLLYELMPSTFGRQESLVAGHTSEGLGGSLEQRACGGFEALIDGVPRLLNLIVSMDTSPFMHLRADSPPLEAKNFSSSKTKQQHLKYTGLAAIPVFIEPKS